MRRTTVAIRRSGEYGPADFVTKIVYRALRGNTFTWQSPATPEDALYRACVEADLDVTLAMVRELLVALPRHGLAQVERAEDGSGALTVPLYPPTVAAERDARALARAARQSARNAPPRPAPTAGTGVRGGASSSERSRRSRNPEAYVDVPRGAPGRPRKTVADPPAKTVADDGEKTVATDSLPAEPGPDTRALAPATPRVSTPFRGVEPGGGEDGVEKTVAVKPGGTKTVAVDPDLAKVPPDKAGGWAGEVLAASRAFSADTTRAGRVELGQFLQSAGYRAEDVRVIAWYWGHDPEGTLQRFSGPTREGYKLYVVRTTELRKHLDAERPLARAWWTALPATLRGQIQRGERAPPRVQRPQLGLSIADNTNALGPPTRPAVQRVAAADAPPKATGSG